MPDPMNSTGTWRPQGTRAQGVKGTLQTLIGRFVWVVLYGDTIVPRCILALIAALWSFMLFLPGDTFERPVYSNMLLIASETYWACAWGTYSVVLVWRIFSASTARAWLALIVNSAGMLLYGTATACIIFSKVWPAPAATAGDIGLSLIAVWVLARSGLNNVPGWRDD